jgi:hypothetical protein
VEGLSIHITAEFMDMVLEIEFDGGLAGFHAFDESTYQSTEGPPGPDAFDGGDFKPLPRPFWRSESNDRIRLYGSLGQFLYENIDTYYLVGAETVLWFDVADCTPTVTVKRPAEQGDGINSHAATADP